MKTASLCVTLPAGREVKKIKKHIAYMKMIPIVILLIICFFVGGAFAEKDETIKMGVFYGSKNMIGINGDWHFNKNQTSIAGSLYYRNGDYPEDYILGADVVLKKYNRPTVKNNYALYEGIGFGYASIRNPSFSRLEIVYLNDSRYGYVYLTGLLGIIFFEENIDIFADIQPILWKDGGNIMLKLGMSF